MSDRTNRHSIDADVGLVIGLPFDNIVNTSIVSDPRISGSDGVGVCHARNSTTRLC